MVKLRTKTPTRDKKTTTSTKKIKKEVKAKAPAKQKTAPKTKKAGARVKKAPKENIYGVLTKAQYEEYLEKKKTLDKHTLEELKGMLRKNDQKTTGKKPQLIEWVAQGEVLGRIPRCPRCFGGKPNFDYKTGQYRCPGFQDDDQFRFCNKKFESNEITREPWIY